MWWTATWLERARSTSTRPAFVPQSRRLQPPDDNAGCLPHQRSPARCFPASRPAGQLRPPVGPLKPSKGGPPLPGCAAAEGPRSFVAVGSLAAPLPAALRPPGQPGGLAPSATLRGLRAAARTSLAALGQPCSPLPRVPALRGSLVPSLGAGAVPLPFAPGRSALSLERASAPGGSPPRQRPPQGRPARRGSRIRRQAAPHKPCRVIGGP